MAACVVAAAAVVIAVGDRLAGGHFLSEVSAFGAVVDPIDIGNVDADRALGTEFTVRSPRDIIGQRGARLELWADFRSCVSGTVVDRPDGRDARSGWTIRVTEDHDRVDEVLWLATPRPGQGRIFVLWQLRRGDQAPMQRWTNGPYLVTGEGGLARPPTATCLHLPKKQAKRTRGA